MDSAQALGTTRGCQPSWRKEESFRDASGYPTRDLLAAGSLILAPRCALAGLFVIAFQPGKDAKPVCLAGEHHS